MQILTTNQISGRSVREGGLIYATAVSAANILRDFQERITNTLGGEMTRYEELIDATVARALERLKNSAREQGYDGVFAVKIANPSVVEGGVEVIVYGTGFHYLDADIAERSSSDTPESV